MSWTHKCCFPQVWQLAALPTRRIQKYPIELDKEFDVSRRRGCNWLSRLCYTVFTPTFQLLSGRDTYFLFNCYDSDAINVGVPFHPALSGATHIQLIQGAQEASRGQVTGRFFHLHPSRRVRLVPWLARWIRKGAVPVATMNMQLAVPEGEEVPDAWHHQLIFGVTSNAVFMTNPLDVGE